MISLTILSLLAYLKSFVIEIKMLILIEALLLTSIIIAINENLFTDLLITLVIVLGACETSIGLCLIIHLFKRC